jgi:hypothetical protein
MYCISKDGCIALEANNFYISDEKSVVRFFREGKYCFCTDPEKSMFCVYAGTGYFMDAYETQEEAKAKLKEVVNSAASGTEIFEF